MSEVSIKVLKSQRARINKMVSEGFASHADVIEALFSAYDLSFSAEKLVKTTNKGDNETLPSERRVQVFIDSLIKYNMNEYDNRKDKEPNFFHISGLRFIANECGVNAARDVKPILEKMESLINRNHAKCGIEKSHNKNPEIKKTVGVVRNGRKVDVSKLANDWVKKQGLSSALGRS